MNFGSKIKGFKEALESNKAINGIYNTAKSRFNAFNSSKTFHDAGRAIIGATEGDSNFQLAKKALVTGGIAYAGLGSAYRVASGGGLYKDKDGNTNIMGVPFV